ncbi:MAG: hypothetical protein MR905_00165 [Prevotella sp.]|nr:hypothetical protein [Prevotella sp.]
MKKYRSLSVKGDAHSLTSLLNQMINSKDKVFKYNEEASNDYKNHMLQLKLVDDAAVFKSSYKKYNECMVFVVLNEGELKVANITSPLINKLSMDDYNVAIETFYEKLIQPFTEAQVIFTNDNVNIEDLTTPEVAKALKLWECACNKSMPTSHPFDEERWFDFIRLSVKSGKSLEPSDLRQWLIEDKKWPLAFNDEIETLTIDYENGIRLLTYYIDHER